MDAVGTAHLTSDIPAQRAVGASVSRRQVTDVLQEPDGAPELMLDFVAAEGGEHATVSMTWSRDDLEQLLGSASGDEMVLVFDRDELASALGDVEAHGPRARAAVFASNVSPSGRGIDGFGAVSRESGHKRVPAPPERITGTMRAGSWGAAMRRTEN